MSPFLWVTPFIFLTLREKAPWHRTALNPLLNSIKNGDVDRSWERSLRSTGQWPTYRISGGSRIFLRGYQLPKWVITNYDHPFGCQIMCIDIYSQCYCVHWYFQQCLIQSNNGAKLLLCNFFCLQLHENERIWTPRGPSLAPPWIRQCVCLAIKTGLFILLFVLIGYKLFSSVLYQDWAACDEAWHQERVQLSGGGTLPSNWPQVWVKKHLMFFLIFFFDIWFFFTIYGKKFPALSHSAHNYIT